MWKDIKEFFLDQFIKLLFQRFLQILALRYTDIEYRCKCIEFLRTKAFTTNRFYTC